MFNQIKHFSLKPTGKVRYIIPSAVSVVRVLLAIFFIAIVRTWPNWILVVAVVGVPFVIILDAVDGVIARHLNSQTLLGSFIDIAADRAVEFIFLQHFVSAGLVPLWFVWVFYCRIVLTDACRVLAFGMERVSATGILLPRPWRSLVLSKSSRSAYASLKGVMFSVLLLDLYMGHMSRSLLDLGIMLSVLAFSLMRAGPILITYLPRVTNFMDPKQRNDTHPDALDIASRSTKVASLVQLLSDVCIAVVLVVLAPH